MRQEPWEIPYGTETPRRPRVQSTPKLCRHKGRALGYVTLNGTEHYLGSWPAGNRKPPAAVLAAYDDLIATWIAHGRRLRLRAVKESGRPRPRSGSRRLGRAGPAIPPRSRGGSSSASGEHLASGSGWRRCAWARSGSRRQRPSADMSRPCGSLGKPHRRRQTRAVKPKRGTRRPSGNWQR